MGPLPGPENVLGVSFQERRGSPAKVHHSLHNDLERALNPEPALKPKWITRNLKTPTGEWERCADLNEEPLRRDCRRANLLLTQA